MRAAPYFREFAKKLAETPASEVIFETLLKTGEAEGRLVVGKGPRALIFQTKISTSEGKLFWNSITPEETLELANHPRLEALVTHSGKVLHRILQYWSEELVSLGQEPLDIPEQLECEREWRDWAAATAALRVQAEELVAELPDFSDGAVKSSLQSFLAGEIDQDGIRSFPPKTVGRFVWPPAAQERCARTIARAREVRAKQILTGLI